MKKQIQDLAVRGGPPAFDPPLHVGRPNVGDRARLRARLDAALDARWLTNDGPLVHELEGAVALLCGRRHGVATCNATAALELLLGAVAPTGEVVLPSFTFVASAYAVSRAGLVPVFADVEAGTATLDAASAEEASSGDTVAVLAVPLWGERVDAAGLARVAQARGVPLLLDAAHALGCSQDGRPVAALGDAAVLSFHATKVVNGGEGGMVVTDDDALARELRLLRNYGFEDYDRSVRLGTNAKMSELSAALALTSLEGLDGFVAANRARADAYAQALRDVPGVRLRPSPPGSTFQYAVLEVEPPPHGPGRDLLHEVLWAEGALARRYFVPGCHAAGPYRDGAAHRAVPLPNTERLLARALVLPNGGEMTPVHATRVGEIVRFAAAHADELRRP